MAGENVCEYNLFITSFSIPSFALSNSLSDTSRHTSQRAILLVMKAKKSPMILTCSWTIHCFFPNSVRKERKNLATGSADLCRSCSRNRWKSKGSSGSGSGGGGCTGMDVDAG